MHRREGVYDSRYLPINTKPPISFGDHETATCSLCGGEWRPSSRNQYSACCHAPRVGHGVPCIHLPARHPFKRPVTDDRLSVSGGSTWREVIKVENGIVIYRSSRFGEQGQCTLHAWEAWGFGMSRGGGRCPAKVERRGQA